MSIWGKLLAGTFGFALGGPIGAMLGVIAGHSVDRIRNQKSDSNIASNSPQEIITIGIIILAAKLAKADGQVTTDEISAFKEKFKIPVFAYQVSGEYSLISNAIKKKIIDKDSIYESLVAFKRSGANAIVSYYADQIDKIIK